MREMWEPETIYILLLGQLSKMRIHYRENKGIGAEVRFFLLEVINVMSKRKEPFELLEHLGTVGCADLACLCNRP